MTPSSSGIGVLASVERLVGAWFDREPGGRATLILLALFVANWTTFQIVSFSSLGLHPDLVELYAWSQHPSAGYHKHPPLGALIAAAWFSVFSGRGLVVSSSGDDQRGDRSLCDRSDRRALSHQTGRTSR